MSEAAERFKTAAKAHDWQTAFVELNGLSMEEMLTSMASLPAVNLDEMLRRTSFCFQSVNMPRIMFAANVVKQHKIPTQIPGDLVATGQVHDAKQFLARTKKGAHASPEPKQTHAGALFSTADAAATAALDEILSVSVANNWEYAGRVQKMGGGYVYTKPNTLKKDADSDAGPIAAGNVGSYHTHAGGFYDTDEDFSPQDKLKATLAREYSYLGTPRGRILRFTPIDLLSQSEQKQYPMGKTDTLRGPGTECK